MVQNIKLPPPPQLLSPSLSPVNVTAAATTATAAATTKSPNNNNFFEKMTTPLRNQRQQQQLLSASAAGNAFAASFPGELTPDAPTQHPPIRLLLKITKSNHSYLLLITASPNSTAAITWTHSSS
jgi:hypothetical protein